MRLSNCHWIEKKQNIITTGPTGVGKSFISSAFGHHSCINGYKTIYFNCPKLFSSLKLLKADGSYINLVNRIQKQNVLILDDFGLHPLDMQSRLFLLEIIEDRYGLNSTIIVS